MLGDKLYNFLGCHLIHGQDARVARNEMMQEILATLKGEREEIEMDVLSDYTIIAGDLNYRFDTTYEDMISTN